MWKLLKPVLAHKIKNLQQLGFRQGSQKGHEPLPEIRNPACISSLRAFPTGLSFSNLNEMAVNLSLTEVTKPQRKILQELNIILPSKT
jgi:hypothetical protein